MNRIWIAVLLVGALGVAAVANTRIDTDARAVLGESGAASSSLDSKSGRSQIVAVSASSQAKRHEATRRIADFMRGHELVADVSSGPAAPSREMLEVLWRYRFALAPPAATAFETDALTKELGKSRASLGRLEDAALADYYLRDPTGSFRHVVEHVSSTERPAIDSSGYWIARDGGTNLIFAELADKPFDAETQAALDAGIRDVAHDAEVLILGPRSITTLVSQTIAQRSQIFGAIATILLLAWLAFVVRSGWAIVACILPLAAGVFAALLLVGALFGSVHVVAFGFGATLLGLAMDYPLHLMAHGEGRAMRRRAVHLVAIGAATTGVTFLALSFAGVPVLAQIGILVAVGLFAAAGIAAWIAPELPTLAAFSGKFLVKPPVLYRKTSILMGLCALASVTLVATAEIRRDPLISVPLNVQGTIDGFRNLTELPSARVRLETSAENLTDLARIQRDLMPLLEDLRTAGEISRFSMFVGVFPDAGLTRDLPDSDTFAANVVPSLERAGFTPSFKNEILDAYEEARHHASPSIDALKDLAKQRGVSTMVNVLDGRLVAPVALYGVTGPIDAVARLRSAQSPGVSAHDTRTAIGESLDDLRQSALTALAGGVAAGLLCLGFLVRQPKLVGVVAVSCAAATLLAAVFSSWIFGGFSIIQIVALALIVGIGIDYGLFTELSRSRSEDVAASRSVVLCAVTTLIAFGTMSFSGIALLEEIAVTVSAGVLIMLGICLTRPENSPKDMT